MSYQELPPTDRKIAFKINASDLGKLLTSTGSMFCIDCGRVEQAGLP